jgi:hypothetical protein
MTPVTREHHNNRFEDKPSLKEGGDVTAVNPKGAYYVMAGT